MTQYLDEVVARIHAVVCGGRGVDGALGPDALARSIAAGHFRRPSNDVSLRDVNYPGAEFDTAIGIQWESSQDELEDSNELDPSDLTIERFELHVGYLFGADLASMISVRGSEAAATVAMNWRIRAGGDARRIKQALCFATLSGGALSSGVSIVGFRRQGATTFDDQLGAGRALSVTVYELRLDTPRGSTLNP